MTDGTSPSSHRQGGKKRWRGSGRSKAPAKQLYGALDLGTNNCRLLIASSHGDGFRVSDGFSRIVRLGEGLDASGQLSKEAMQRSLDALKICAHKLAKAKVKRIRAVATQACRRADNGEEFIQKVREEIGLSIKIISCEEEARLALRGCQDLLDHTCEAALVLDIGGGSTELSWIKLGGENGKGHRRVALQSWVSLDIGVITLSERFPEQKERDQWFADMVAHARQKIQSFQDTHDFLPVFQNDNAHYIGTSGAVTSLGGVHLNLGRYQRAKVDGLWLSDLDAKNATARLLSKTKAQRAEEPCIGEERADMVLAGCAILQAVQDEWPATRIRVADRGLREGLLLSMMAFDGKKRGPRGRRR